MNIYIGNLSFRAKNEDLSNLFSEFGEVTSVRIIRDRETKRSRGFAFVEMSDDAAGQNAIASLNAKEFMERELIVNEAKPREEKE